MLFFVTKFDDKVNKLDVVLYCSLKLVLQGSLRIYYYRRKRELNIFSLDNLISSELFSISSLITSLSRCAVQFYYNICSKVLEIFFLNYGRLVCIFLPQTLLRESFSYICNFNKILPKVTERCDGN